MSSESALPTGANWIDRLVDVVKRRERFVLIIGVAFQIVVLGGTIMMRSPPLLSGDTVLLRVYTARAQDMLHRDHVTLTYAISYANVQGLPGISPHAAGQTVYVTLVPEADGRHFRNGAAVIQRPLTGKYIRGTIDRYGRIEFGIESYYVQEMKAQDYEEAERQGRQLSAEVAISPDGQAALRGLRIEP